MKFIFEKAPKQKGTCPQCKEEKVFRYYEGLSREFGICDRVNNCGHKNIPTKEALPEYKEPEQKKEAVKTIYPAIAFVKKTIENQTSNFHDFVNTELSITNEHLIKWNCGTIEDKTAYVYQNIEKKYLNIVHIFYSENGKRIKETLPFSLHPAKERRETEKYALCLFGEHLLTKKTVCLVESEKTAIIASFSYPQFDWLATGGANKLTDEKISVLFGRKIYYLSDADKAGTENSTIKKLAAYKQDYTVIQLFPDRTDGYDLADAIIDGLKPEIKPTETQNLNFKKNVSDFEKVENFLSDRYEIRDNIVSHAIEFRKKDSKEMFEELNENNIYIELQKNFINFSMAKVVSLLKSDYISKHNPFLDYFENLKEWNETRPDYISRLCQYIPIRESEKERFNVQFKKMLVRCIPCSLIPGVFNKQAFIFVHEQQNSGKSTFCRWLCPPTLSNYIAENISTDKDSLISLCENFIINMDELATLNKAEINTLKAMMSKDAVKVRIPFEKRPKLEQRRANFVGSTNKTEFLSDETGSVRWICFELMERFNFDYKKDIDIDDVWSQAYTLFKQGFKYELSPEEIADNEKANSTYQIITDEQELIHKTYEPADQHTSTIFFQASDIKLSLLEKYPFAKLSNVNIGKALKILGFKRESKRNDKFDYPIKGYYLNFRLADFQESIKEKTVEPVKKKEPEQLSIANNTDEPF